jgi:hypothetical protein
MLKWKCHKCDGEHEEIRFCCKYCNEPLKGEISNVRIVEREKGIKEFLDFCWEKENVG